MNPEMVVKLAGGMVVGLVVLGVSMGFGDVFYKQGATPEESVYKIEIDPSLATKKAVLGAATSGGEAEAVEAVDVMALLAAADVEKGAKLVKRKCMTCHHVDAAKGNHTGPNLYGVVGRDVGSAEGFAYSDGFAAIEGNWDADKLYAFLTKPKAYIPGTKMAFAGFKKDKDKANVIAYLKTLSDE